MVELGFGSPSAIGKLLSGAPDRLRGRLAVSPAGGRRSRRSSWPAATAAVRPTPPRRPPDGHHLVFALSALLFAAGVSGVLLRRSPLVILLCLELMLNAGNLAPLAFSRSLGNQDGTSPIVMVIAAREVVVGWGIIVAAYRRRIPAQRRRPAHRG